MVFGSWRYVTFSTEKTLFFFVTNSGINFPLFYFKTIQFNVTIHDKYIAIRENVAGVFTIRDICFVLQELP